MSDNSENNQKNKKRQSEDEIHNGIVQLSIRDVKNCEILPETLPICDIEFADLKDLKFVQSGGFGDVYKGIFRGQHIAAKYVRRKTPTELKDFDRE
ncbi:13680_t:CDS:1, partial [Gigaspora rosea]